MRVFGGIFWLDGAGWTFSYEFTRMNGGMFWVVGGYVEVYFV